MKLSTLYTEICIIGFFTIISAVGLCMFHYASIFPCLHLSPNSTLQDVSTGNIHFVLKITLQNVSMFHLITSS